MAVNIHITIIELNALHTKRQNLFQELDAVIHLLMEAKHWGLRKSRNATSLNSRFKSLDTLKVKIISVTFRRDPTGSVDPNFGRRVRNRRQLNSLQNTWPYGYSMPIAVRYTQDAFSRSGWLWPVDAKGEPLKATSYMAVGFYV